MTEHPRQRTIVVGLVWNEEGKLLLCKMDARRGVFPGQWGLPGGGVKQSEWMGDALRRELREELGIEVGEIKPAFFKDGLHEKTMPDGTIVPVYMIFLIFHCRALSEEVQLNEEFSEYRWVAEDEVSALDLNEQTIDTLARLGEWPGAA